MVAALDSKSNPARGAGSIPALGTRVSESTKMVVNNGHRDGMK